MPLFASRARRAVTRGARLLDKVIPGWFDNPAINLSILSTKDPRTCILAQLFGRYFIGGNVLGFPNPYRHGFDIPPSKWGAHTIADRLDAYRELDDEWRNAVYARRAAKRVKDDGKEGDRT